MTAGPEEKTLADFDVEEMDRRLTASFLHHPPGWPIIEKDMFMGCINNVKIVLHDGVGQASFERFLHETAHFLDWQPEDTKLLGINYYRSGAWWSSMSLHERTQYMRKFGEMFRPRKAKMARTTLGTAMVVNSALVRATIRTVLVFVPLGHPATAVDSLDKAWPFIERHAKIAGQPTGDARELTHYVMHRYLPGLLK